MQATFTELGRQPYAPVLHAMREWSRERSSDSMDQFWSLEHEPVFTQGQAGRAEHVLNPGDIPVVRTDRGGQVTYHGPGQAVLYVLVNLHALGLGVRSLVRHLEGTVIALLASHGIQAHAREDAPGVYVEGAKVASLGLRITRGFSYHGIALNVDLDLAPFDRINPCGHAGMAVTRLRDLGIALSVPNAGRWLAEHLSHTLGYQELMTAPPSALCYPIEERCT